MNGIITIGIIGDFDKTHPSHVATNEAVSHSAKSLAIDVKVEWLPTVSFMKGIVKRIISKYDGIIASPGSPYKSMDGMIKAIRAAREMNLPFIGT
jgi:CTP synthase (UTP-ammonia lyase)